MKSAALCAVAFIFSGCGTRVGNPGTETSSSASFIQPVDYDVPNTVSGNALVEEEDGLFKDSMLRLDKALDRTNALIARLNTDSVNGAGTFTGKGPDGKLATVVSEQTGTYNYRALICYDGTLIQVVDWSSVTGDVQTTRRFDIDPIEKDRASDAISTITYTAGTPATLKVALRAGPSMPLNLIPPGQDGGTLTERIVSTRTGDNYTMSGIHNWVNHTTVAEITSEGDEYFIGTFNTSGTGETVGYNVARTNLCAATFNESSPSTSWCTGKTLAGVIYDKAAVATAVERLKAIPVVKAAELINPTLPAGLTCP